MAALQSIIVAILPAVNNSSIYYCPFNIDILIKYYNVDIMQCNRCILRMVRAA